MYKDANLEEEFIKLQKKENPSSRLSVCSSLTELSRDQVQDSHWPAWGGQSCQIQPGRRAQQARFGKP